MSKHDEILQGLNRLIGENVKLVQERDALREEVERLKQAQRWIPVEERLPQKNGDFWAVHLIGPVVCEFDLHYQWFGVPVTHWMPLPPLPKEEVQG